jgi:predicted dehydrogenase
MIRIAIIGAGGMGQHQVKSFQAITGCRVAAVCDLNAERAAETAKRFNIPVAYGSVTDLLAQEKLDAVSIVANDSAHRDLCLLAIKHGLHVMCEKPLATNLKDAGEMARAARKKKIITAVNFVYRNAAGTQQAAELARTGKLGRIIHVEGSYLQSWLSSKSLGDWRTTPAWLWRLSTKHGSLGTLGDIGVHLYDLATFVVGDIAELACELKTFDKGQKSIGEYLLDANDSVVTTARFRNGALGTLHTTRWAAGHKNTVALRVFGDKGSLDLNLDRPAGEQLRVCLGEKNRDAVIWKPMKCPKVPNMYERFIAAIKSGKQGQAGFDVGAKVQAYLEYSLASAKKHAFVAIPKF